jgi:hypothetical protein
MLEASHGGAGSHFPTSHTMNRPSLEVIQSILFSPAERGFGLPVA